MVEQAVPSSHLPHKEQPGIPPQTKGSSWELWDPRMKLQNPDEAQDQEELLGEGGLLTVALATDQKQPFPPQTQLWPSLAMVQRAKLPRDQEMPHTSMPLLTGLSTSDPTAGWRQSCDLPPAPF